MCSPIKGPPHSIPDRRLASSHDHLPLKKAIVWPLLHQQSERAGIGNGEAVVHDEFISSQTTQAHSGSNERLLLHFEVPQRCSQHVFVRTPAQERLEFDVERFELIGLKREPALSSDESMQEWNGDVVPNRVYDTGHAPVV